MYTLRRIMVGFYRREVIRSVVRPFFRKRKPEKWVFIVGCYNSGTTLLTDLLGFHRDISVLPTEGAALTKFLKMPEEYGWARMVIKCHEQIMKEATKDSLVKERIIKDWSPWLRKGAKVFVEKSVTNTLRIRWLEENFENSSFLGIVRNSLAVSEGIRRRAKPGNYGNKYYRKQYPLELCAQQWQMLNDIMLEQMGKVQRSKIIKYEQLVENPIEVLKDIWGWIGLKENHVSFVNGKLRINEKEIILENKNRAIIESLTNKEKYEILKKSIRGMKKFGYIEPAEDSIDSYLISRSHKG